MPVLLAAMLVALIGMTGLAVDFGFSTLERRALQNAADAAVLSGAANLSQGLSPSIDVTTIANRNATTTSVSCQYVNTSNADSGPCTGSMIGASGLHVTASHTRDTFFMRVLGVPQVTVSAEAIARISAMQNSVGASASTEAQNALFIVCGYQTKLYGPGNNKLDILAQNPTVAPYNVNPLAWGREFVIQNPQVTDCGMPANSFKGLNGTHGTVALPADLRNETGTNAGPTVYSVNGFNGCGAGLSSNDVDNCVMLLPIADGISTTYYSPDGYRLHAVRWLPFKIRLVDSNTTTGTLLNEYRVSDPSTSFWPWVYGGTAASGITSVRIVH
jgi:hypothetical protein